MVSLTGVTKSYGRLNVLKDVSLEVAGGEFLTLLGPSGAGKTTLLRLLSGQEPVDSGSIVFAHPPTKDHPVLMVFQDFSLFPHMTVRENVEYGLRMRRVPREERRARSDEMLTWFDIRSKAEEYPTRLSAGQQQRTALARALVVNPSVLLLDEPFANLDKNLKTDTAAFVRRTQRRFGITTVMVTHDQEEAFAASDRIGVLIDGRLRQLARPDELYRDPADLDVARFLGPVNQVPTALRHLLELADDAGEGPVAFRTEAAELITDPEGPAVVTDRAPTGKLVLYRVDLEGTEVLVHALRAGPRVGDRVRITVHHCLSERNHAYD